MHRSFLPARTTSSAEQSSAVELPDSNQNAGDIIRSSTGVADSARSLLKGSGTAEPIESIIRR